MKKETSKFPLSQQHSCQEDLNGDGLVSVNDILVLLSDFGCSANCDADVDLDDAVSILALLQILSAFGDGLLMRSMEPVWRILIFFGSSLCPIRL